MKNDSTQQSIEIAGIKNGILIMKDLSYRVVLEVASINFNLKSDIEQNSIIFQYQSFLNSLHFPVQVVIRSKKLDLTPYINKLKAIGNKQENSLIRSQTLDYANFVGQLIDVANIMKKSFYVIVPYSATNIKNISLVDRLFGNSKKIQGNIKLSESEFKANSTKLLERANIVASGIGAMGLHCSQLNTEQLIELFYGAYNPHEAGHERLTDYLAVSAPIITNQEQLQKPNQNILEKVAMIDNTPVVEEQKKKEAMERAEAQKDLEVPPVVEQFKTAPETETATKQSTTNTNNEIPKDESNNTTT